MTIRFGWQKSGKCYRALILLYIAVVVGTRPEIVKLAPVIRVLGSAAKFLHTGQHSDDELSGAFLAGARIPQPEFLSGICGELLVTCK